MELFEAIHNRRSIRVYEDKDVPEELVENILKAGMAAPSAGNQQPWEYIVLTEREILDKVPEINEYAQMAKEAHLAILVCGDTGREKFAGYWVVDCSAAVQNMLLAAHALGLGAVWTGICPMKDRIQGFKKLLDLPEKVMPHSLVILGYPAREIEPEDRYNPAWVHYNGW